MRTESNARKSWNFISRSWFILLRGRVHQVVRKLHVQIEQISFRPTLGPFRLKPADVLQLICRKGGEGGKDKCVFGHESSHDSCVSLCFPFFPCSLKLSPFFFSSRSDTLVPLGIRNSDLCQCLLRSTREVYSYISV